MRGLDTAARDAALRPRIIDASGKRILVSRLSGTSQEADLSAPTNCGGFGRIRHFRMSVAPGWPDNPLPIEPASRWLGIPTPREMPAQVFQIAACAWRCWYCYVPYPSLRADPSSSEWRSAEALVDAYLELDSRPPMLDLSGGSPDLAPEWIAWTLQAIADRRAGASTYVWSDDNLSSDRLLADRGLLRSIAEHGNYGRACCLKGFDEESFAFNTKARPEGFERQMEILSGYAASGIDIYLYMPLVGPPGSRPKTLVERTLDRLGRIRADLPARTVPLIISRFGAMKGRLSDIHEAALQRQWEMVKHWKALAPEFSASAPKSAPNSPPS